MIETVIAVVSDENSNSNEKWQKGRGVNDEIKKKKKKQCWLIKIVVAVVNDGNSHNRIRDENKNSSG